LPRRCDRQFGVRDAGAGYFDYDEKAGASELGWSWRGGLMIEKLD
jgi:hypothetical protein